MNFLAEYLRKIWKIPALSAAFAALMAAVLFLYDIPAEPVFYGAAFCGIVGLVFFFYGYFLYRKRRSSLLRVSESPAVDLQRLPPPADKNEELYQQMLWELNRQRMEAEAAKLQFYRELVDYYTMWVHQIKTPIAAMRLIMQGEEPDGREALDELLKVEQYVEMVLGYLRTEDISSDMNFSECSLDKIIREQIHKYARLFIRRKLSLEYEGVEERVLTDPKWLGFVIGQLFSNALKYTKKGKISVYMSKVRPHTLVVEDTGIGIRPEDLPRIYERGFTGYNGRQEKQSTGIGLYLCAKIMKKLGHGIMTESEPGRGTRVYLSLGRENLEIF